MLAPSLLAVVLLFFPMSSHALEPAPKADNVPAAVAPGGSRATTESSASTQPADASAHDDSLVATFSKTHLGQLFEGKKRVSLDDVKDPMFWLATVRDLLITVLGFIPRVVVALLFVIFFWGIYRMVRRIVIGSLNAAHVDPSIRDMLGHLLKWTIMGFGIVIACNQIGIQIAALLTGVSIIGLAVGFAAQETLSNFIAGIVIFWDKPFKIGDWVEIDQTYGQVQRVTFRSTRLLDKAGQVIIFPNTHMLSSKLSNHTTHRLTRVKVLIGIGYGDSIDHARRVLLGLTAGDRRIASDPAPSVGVEACAESSVNLGLYFWVEDESIERALAGEYLEKAKKAFDESGISIPFPHMQLVLDQSTSLKQLAADPMPLRKAS